MEKEEGTVCAICAKQTQSHERVLLKCQHMFCNGCLRAYIAVLKSYRQLTPQKLKCMTAGCEEQIADDILTNIFPGQEGFILKTIKKCYKQSKNPSSIIFSCIGFLKSERKTLIEKTAQMSRDEHSRLTNQLVKQIQSGQILFEDVKSCNNIHIYNKSILSKDKVLQCFICGVSYCLSCFEVSHSGTCPIIKQDPMLQLKKGKNGDNFQEFIALNQIRRCLNPKCAVPIEKQQGCFWVKCRCSWQMCYPCGKLWGNCEHFSKYPYQKFTPPAEWLVKALNLY